MAFSSIDKGSSYFNTVLWTGNNSSPRNIDTGHATDFIWVKFRTNPYNHRLFDSVRGGTKRLISNSTSAEDTASTDVTGFLSTGFTIDANINNSADGALVGWSWLGGGTGVSNTSGTITSTVSANTTSGFSIVSYTGNGTNNATVGHGLGTTPAMLIVKNRDVADGWGVWNKGLGAATQQLGLNLTNAVFTDDIFNAVSSTLVTLGTDTWSNTSTKNYIMYCWSEVKGFSKFGSYTGNGSTDGTFVYTGFKPAFVLVKDSSAVTDWNMYDNKRNTYNVADLRLYPNLSNAEATYAVFDFVSNGFKIRNSGGNFNTSGDTYIYMAFAENPFCTSKGIPVTAR